MGLVELLQKYGITKYRLAIEANIPHTTIFDICSGKTRIEKCTAETIYKIAKALNVNMEMLVRDSILQKEMEESYEVGLPKYLQHDLDEYKKGVKEKSTLLDCLWGELYSSINIAEIDDGKITHEHAEYLRNKFLWGEK